MSIPSSTTRFPGALFLCFVGVIGAAALAACTGAPESENPPRDDGGGAGAVDAGGGGGAGPGPGDASAGAERPPVQPGSGVVLVLDAQTGVRSCVPLCIAHTDPAADPEHDDWSFENGASCVISGTPTGMNQACTTGQPVPPPPSVAGVVAIDTATGMRRCYPLCASTVDRADPQGDGWSWENSASCIITGGVMASNQACTTGQPVPPPASRPGILVARDGETICAPLCRVATVPTGGMSDWSYEETDSCVLPTSPTAQGRRSCTFGVPRTFKPPALTGAKMTDGFSVSGGRLRDAYGQDFIIRGVNNLHVWFDRYAEYKAYLALDNIAGYGANTIRVVWDTTGTASLLAEILFRIVELKMVPMVELHDVTGIRDAARLMTVAEYYTRSDVLAVLKDFREYLLVNVANEWSGGDVYLATYQTVIGRLRAAGIDHTLVIDASGFGQNATSILDNAAPLLASDPRHNLLFSIHMYDLFADPARVDTVLNQAVAASVPLIVGEFGHQLAGTNVAWRQILAACNRLRLGYLAWSWMGNDADTAQLNMATGWEGPLTTWGDGVLNGAGGIKETARKASIFP